MRPHLLKIPKHHEHSFSIRHDLVPFFYNKWHYHPEIELVYFMHKIYKPKFILVGEGGFEPPKPKFPDMLPNSRHLV